MSNEIKPGDVFGRWTVVSFAGRDAHGHMLWHLQCGCGTKGSRRGDILFSRKSKSCGCYAAQVKARRRYAFNTRRVDNAENEREFFNGE